MLPGREVSSLVAVAASDPVAVADSGLAAVAGIVPVVADLGLAGDLDKAVGPEAGTDRVGESALFA